MSTVDVRSPFLPIQFNLNGKQVELNARAGSRLLDVLREDGHMFGVKEGCGEGECGACTVMIDGEVVTVEGLPDRVGQKVHPVQHHFVEEMGTQCGFCTPGMVLSAVALLEENPSASREEILDGISGNLCRCTGYIKIVEAIERAQTEMTG